MNKKIILTLILAIVALAGHSQIKVWDKIVMGYANVPFVKVTKVAIYDDRTEIFIHMDMPKQAAGQSSPLAISPTLKADGKVYAVKGATVIKLNEPYTIPADCKVDFSLIFEPISANTWMIDVTEPKMWSISNIHDAGSLPTGLTDTYWRNVKTGDWLIGFTQHHVIYNNKVVDIVTQTEKKDSYKLMLNDGTIVKVSKMKKGLRSITIGKERASLCSPITGATLPDYPTKDTSTGFVDNGYQADDSVTIIGWLKDMPKQAWKKGKDFQIAVKNIILDRQENFFTKMDSLGRFHLKMPLLNSSQAFLDWGRTTKSTLLEPEKTYFFLYDFKTGQMIWMGDDVRVQNELLAYPHDWNNDRIEISDQGKISAMQFKTQTDNSRKTSTAKLEENIRLHPNLSQRYIDYLTGYYLTSQGESMMQARFAMPNRKLPQEYMDYVGKELWKKAAKPYTLYRDFSTFMRDYLDQLRDTHQRNTSIKTVEAIRKLEQQGIVQLTKEEQDALSAYVPMLKALETNLQKAKGSDNIDSLVNAFNTQPTIKKVYNLFNRIGAPFRDELAMMELSNNLFLIDSIGCDRNLRDIFLTHSLYMQIDNTRLPLKPALLSYAEQNIQLPSVLAVLKAQNDKYIVIKNMDISESACLKSSEDVANMSDGEKILRKICEPYKGKIILLDIWGTWCGPCKEMLSHSQEEYERLKEFDLIYLYLCNRSSDESWKNVIKEYNVVGKNVVHYNLPQEQQTAVENFLQVKAFPTYKLIDRNGNVLNVNASPRNLEKLASLLESMK